MSSQIASRQKGSFFKAPRNFCKRGANGFPIGPRTEKRQEMNRELNKLPDSVRKVCELRIKGVCIGNRMLTWAHSKKSRFLCTDKDWLTACRACLACHQEAEQMSHRVMAALIDEAIAGRKL
jgi:hypothetical protein